MAELFLGSILLSNRFEVYEPLVDVAVGYLSHSPTGQTLMFQCKSRSKPDAVVFDLSLPKATKARLPTHVFYMRGPADRPEYWIVPFRFVRKLCKRMTGKTGRTVYQLYLTERTVRALRDFRNEDGVKEMLRYRVDRSH